MSESVILCEGYYDRAFWAGWLEHLGCTDPGRPPGKTIRVRVLDPWGSTVVGGQFGYYSPSGQFVRVFPCHGKAEVVRDARNRLDEEGSRLAQGASEPRLTRLILTVNADTNADGTSSQTGFRCHDLRAIVSQFDSAATDTEDGDILLFRGTTVVSLVRWEAEDPPAPGLPNQQTLERLVCAALIAAYPDRGPAVQAWLDSRPNAAQAGPKEFGWSYMAGWYADHGCEGFYRALWGEAVLAAQLKSRLQACGARRVAEALAQ